MIGLMYFMQVMAGSRQTILLWKLNGSGQHILRQISWEKSIQQLIWYVHFNSFGKLHFPGRDISHQSEGKGCHCPHVPRLLQVCWLCWLHMSLVSSGLILDELHVFECRVFWGKTQIFWSVQWHLSWWYKHMLCLPTASEPFKGCCDDYFPLCDAPFAVIWFNLFILLLLTFSGGVAGC